MLFLVEPILTNINCQTSLICYGVDICAGVCGVCPDAGSQRDDQSCDQHEADEGHDDEALRHLAGPPRGLHVILLQSLIESLLCSQGKIESRYPCREEHDQSHDTESH